MPTLTITVAAAPAARIAAAVGRRLSLTDESGAPRSATLAEVTEAMRGVLRNWVEQSEAEVAAKAAATAIDIT